MVPIIIVAIVFAFCYLVTVTALHYAERLKIHEENIRRLEHGYPPIEAGGMGVLRADKIYRVVDKAEGLTEYAESDDERANR